MSGREYVDRDEWVALHRVALQAREAVEVAADAGVHLGPLRAALDATAYRVSSPFARTPQNVSDDDDAPTRTRRVIVSGGQPGMTTADIYEVDVPDG